MLKLSLKKILRNVISSFRNGQQWSISKNFQKIRNFQSLELVSCFAFTRIDHMTTQIYHVILWWLVTWFNNNSSVDSEAVDYNDIYGAPASPAKESSKIQPFINILWLITMTHKL